MTENDFLNKLDNMKNEFFDDLLFAREEMMRAELRYARKMEIFKKEILLADKKNADQIKQCCEADQVKQIEF